MSVKIVKDPPDITIDVYWDVKQQLNTSTINCIVGNLILVQLLFLFIVMLVTLIAVGFCKEQLSMLDMTYLIKYWSIFSLPFHRAHVMDTPSN